MLASDLIKELEKAIAVIGDVGVYVFEGETLEVKVEVLEESDMIVVRTKTQEEAQEDKLAEAIVNMAKCSVSTIEQTEQRIKQMLSNGKIPMGPWLELQERTE